MSTRMKLVDTIIAFDRRQEKMAQRNPVRHHHNVYALAQYLQRIDDIMDDIKAGTPIDQAVTAGFTPGPLRTACLKALGLADSKAETGGSHLGLPVYRKISEIDQN
jgi:hypothetical protein